MFSCDSVGRALPRGGGWAPAGRSFRFAAVLALWVVAFRADAIAAVFTVTKTADTSDGVCDGDCSLREAVTAANAAPGADTVTAPAGVYVLTQGTSITITGDTDVAGAGRGATILDGNHATVVLRVDASAIQVTVRGITIRNGYRQGSFGPIGGAGIVVGQSNASLTLEDAELLGDRTWSGGGGVDSLYTNRVTLRRVSVVDVFENAVYASDVTLENVEIRGATGYGVFCGGTCVVSSSTIRDNASGGIATGSQTVLTVTDSTLSGNHAPEIHPGRSDVAMTVERSFLHPRPGGSAVDLFGGVSLTLRNSTIMAEANPSAPDLPCYYGGIQIESGKTTNGVPVLGNVVTIESSTIQALTSEGTDAAAICLNTVHPLNQLSVTNSIIRGQCFAMDLDHLYGGPLAPGRVVSGGGNVESGGDTCTLGDVTDSVGVTAAALALGPVADNGGSTQTLALDPASVAINHAVAGSCPPVDQRGVSRPQGAGCDSGAYEAEARCTDGDTDGFAFEGGACGPVDCLDTNAQVNPGHAEVPGNGLDDDCNAATSDCPDSDGDGYSPAGGTCGPGDCNDGNVTVNPGHAEVAGNGVDDDCNPATPDCVDADGDGYSVSGGVCGAVDCADTNAQVNPGKTEIPGNGFDDDCNVATSDCKDLDADGYGNPASTACAHPQLDCSDSNANVSPGRTEIPSNGIDDDCNAATPGGCSAP